MKSNVQSAATASYQRRRYRHVYRVARRFMEWARYDRRYRTRLTEELFRKHAIPFERQRVFELGFGSGELLLRFDTTSSIHGCDISESAVTTMQKDPRARDYQNPTFVHSSSSGDAVFPADEYDIVIASHVIEHVPDDLAMLRSMAAHTRLGGYALFFMPLEPPRHNPDHARSYTAAGFCELLTRAGFCAVDVRENFRYASHFVQSVNWPSRARLPVIGPLVEVAKTLALAVPPTGFVRWVEEPLERLHIAPYQLMVLARRVADGAPQEPVRALSCAG